MRKQTNALFWLSFIVIIIGAAFAISELLIK